MPIITSSRTAEGCFSNQYGHQFFEQTHKHRPIDADTRALINRLLLERISMAGISRALRISEQWLQDYVNKQSA